MYNDNIQRIRLTRQELYDLVWEKPVTKLAKEFGLSDVGLAKACRRHDIPLPPRGYWAKLQHGRRAPVRPALSKKRPLDEEISLTGYLGVRTESGQSTKLADFVDSPPSLHVPKTLTEPHPLVEKTAQILRSARRTDELIQPRRNSRILDLHVSHTSLERALRIVDTFIKALEQVGLPIDISKDTKATYTEIDGERLEFQLREELDKVPHTPTQTELRRKERFPWHDIPTHDAVPSGRLTLAITNLTVRGMRRRWSDGKHQRLEDRLESFLVGLYQASSAIKKEQEERERRHREWEAEWQRREEARRWQRLEEERVERFQKDVANWRKAQEYWAYIRQVET